MKKKLLLLCLFTSFLFCGTMLTSCGSKKSGCPVNENAHVKPNKKGMLPSKRGKSNLFPKNMRKKGR